MQLEQAQESKETVEETTTETAPTQEENTTPSNEVEREEDSSGNSEETPSEEPQATKEGDVDYEALYEEERKRREKAEKVLVKQKRDARQQVEDQTTGLDVDVDSIAEKVEQVVAQRLNEFEKTQFQGLIEDTIKANASNNGEAKLIQLHYEQSLQPSGFTKADVLRDVKRAKLLANEKKYDAKVSELTAAAKAKQTTQTTPNGSSQPVQEGAKENLSPQAQRFLQAAKQAADRRKR